jgi:hypothetical protein
MAWRGVAGEKSLVARSSRRCSHKFVVRCNHHSTTSKESKRRLIIQITIPTYSLT